jgi:hypothetical protein
VPFLLLPGAKNAVTLTFRSPAEIAPRGEDRFYLYYGAKNPAPPDADPRRILGFWEDFSRPDEILRSFRAAPGILTAIEGDAWILREAPAGRPSRIEFLDVPKAAGFEVSFDLAIDAAPPAGASFGLVVDLEDAAVIPDAERRARTLAADLGDDAFEKRDAATKALIALGRSALAALNEALRSDDAEVKWRAGHAIREIEERHPSPRIRAGVTGTANRAVLISEIGRSKASAAFSGDWPMQARVSIRRDPDGDVSVRWGERELQIGPLPGKLGTVAFSLEGTVGARVGHVAMKPFVDEEARPTTRIEVEESRP